MSNFSTLSTATSGLSAAQRAIDATSQNIVNANTPGYSRQRVLLASLGGTPAASFHTGNSKTAVGGVRVSDVVRIRDAFLEATRAAAGGRQAALTSRTQILQGTELLLAEPGETGLQSSMDSFYSAWHDLGSNPTNSSAGSVVIQRGLAVAQQLKSVSTGLSSQWTVARHTLVDVAARVNQASSELATLNDGIRAGQASGKPVNELLDKRDQLVRDLAGYVGGYATTDDEGLVSVSVNGVSIVSGSDWSEITVSGAFDLSTAGSDPPGLTVGSYSVPVEYGSAAGLLATLRTDLPELSAKVDSVALSMIESVNAVYALGYDSNGDTGLAFFSGTDAKSISVVPAVGGSLAIASAAGIADGSVARRVGDLADDAISAATLAAAGVGGDGASVQWRNLTTTLGVQLQSLKTAEAVQDAVVSAAEDSVQSDAGVNLDEEMTNLMLFQRAYQASARVITTTDDLLETLINRTGRVGL
ncbi:MAG: flagellar hook-associated protein FlgK [Actinomycetota bacterium]|nr:flagellar hook-associated protein FlgK [Actinomycetota bacterium]